MQHEKKLNKAELVKQRKEQARKEQAEVNRRRAAELGLGYVAVDVPPDEVDVKDVKRTQLNAFLSMVPYTNAWYEAQAALAEMDDLKRIRIERVKAEDLHLMTKVGRHEEALEKMMAETNYDFFYFNKLKDKHEKEGKWSFSVPNLNPFSFLSAGKDRNRIKKAFGSNFNLIETGSSSITALNVNEKNLKGDSILCLWRGKSKNGEALKCNNKRMERPSKKANGIPELMSHCIYHASYCVGESHKPEDPPAKISVPNKMALCVECYTLKTKKKIPPLTSESVPGVVPSAIMSTLGAKSTGAKDDPNLAILTLKKSTTTAPIPVKRKKKATTCQWKPNKNNERLRMWMCANPFFKDPATGKVHETCAYHITLCIRAHEPNTNNIVTVPNIYGLCSMHHLAEQGIPPPQLPFPYPGMKMRQAADFWKSGKGRHWATPKWEPPLDIHLRKFEEAEPPDCIDAVLNFIKRFRFGTKAARLIQRVYRGYRFRKTHLLLRYQKAIPKRRAAAIVIQAQMRRFLRTKFMQERRRIMNVAGNRIQKIFRGWACRRRLKKNWAARRIVKLMKKLHLFKFKDLVIMVIQLKRMFKRRADAALLLQRFFRGFRVRNSIFRNRLWEFIMKRSARLLQRFLRKAMDRIRRSRLRKYGESWALEQCAKKLSRMILEMYLDRMRRRELFAIMNKSAPEIQRLVRGFLAKAGAKKMSYLRNSFRSWLQPKFAVDFLQRTLNNKIFYLKTAQVGVQRAFVEKPQYVRLFLKDDLKKKFEVDYRSFDSALDLWYKSIGMPLSKSERELIKKTFKNPMNGNINVFLLDDFISLHKLPCRKHGRTICCVCSFRRDCMIKGCDCQSFQSKKPSKRRSQVDTSICKLCDHAGTLHTLCPLQLQEQELGSTNLIGIMNAARQPDMSLPLAIEGIPVEDALIPKLTADEERFNLLKTVKQTEKAKTLATANEVHTLEKSLCLFDVAGNEVYDNENYWTQHSSNTLDSSAATGISGVINVDVKHIDWTPNYGISSSEFWHLTSLNPNKSTRDYHEKFEHNMPVPIVFNGELRYTFEGPKVYYNILNQIIRMEKNIDVDDADFLKLIVDNIQIFERHWRKMVADIRTAKLDRNLQISEEARLAFEASNLPRPLLASKLDFTFRQLGFHKKVLGKDINIQQFAEKKEWTIKETRINAELKRKTSHPTLDATAIDDFVRTLSRDGISSQSPTKSLQGVRPDSTRQLTSGTVSSPLSKSRPQTMSKRQQILQAISGDQGKKSPRSDSLAITIGAAGTRLPLSSESKQRRGSETDVQLRPSTVSSQEVDRLNYAQLSASRIEYNQVLEMPIGEGESHADSRFVCPFPACGMSFHSREAAFRHMPSHELKARLAAPTPLADSHLSLYWPEDVTWKTAPKFTERVLPPGSFACPVAGCNAVFAFKAKLELHTRMVHMHVGDSSVSLGFFKLLGGAISVPPYPLPEAVQQRSQLSFCPQHVVFSGACATCVKAASKQKGPTPPFRFYPSLDLDMKAKRQVENLASRKADSVVRIEGGSWNVGVIVSIPDSSSKSSVELKGRVVSILVDKKQDCWLEVEFLYAFKEVQARGLDIPVEQERRRELFRPSFLSVGPIAVQSGRWVRIAWVQNIINLRLCESEDEMLNRLNDSTESRVNTFFVRNYM